MAAKPFRVYYDVASDSPVLGKGALSNLTPRLYKRDYYEFQLQAVRTHNFTPRLDGTVAAHIDEDISGSVSNAYLILKTPQQYTDGNVCTASWSGLNTGGSWHSLANGRAGVLFSPASGVAPGEYVLSLILLDSSNRKWHVDRIANLSVVQDVYTGTESNIAGGLATNVGTVTVLAGATTATLSYSGMTSGGVVIASLLGVAEPTTITVTCSTNSVLFTLGASYDTDVTVGYYIAKL